MKITTIDYQAKDAAKEFSNSLIETGFGVLDNHPISSELIHDVYKSWESFFQSDSKQDYHYVKPSQAGYAPYGTESAKDSQVDDLKEFFNYYPNGPIPAALLKTTQSMFEALSTLSIELLGWIESQLPKDIAARLSTPLNEMVQNGENTMLRIIHYPPLPEHIEEGAIRAAAHEDINLITLIPAASAQGLQVKDSQGRWHDVSCESGNVVVNVGDMLQMCTEHYYKSTTHRVVNPEGEAAKTSRYSMPLFLHPRKSVKLSPEQTAESYLTQRLHEIGVY